MMGKTTPEQFRKMAASERLEYDALLNRYGDGVRPSWVSEELSYHQRKAKYYDDVADELDAAEAKLAELIAEKGDKL